MKTSSVVCSRDNDIKALASTVDLFGDDIPEKVPGWDLGGGVYADFALMCSATGDLNQEAIEGLRKRLVVIGRKFKKGVDLGKLPIEELSDRRGFRYTDLVKDVTINVTNNAS